MEQMYFTPDEAAEYCRMSRATFYRFRERLRIPHIATGQRKQNRTLYAKVDLDDALTRCKTWPTSKNDTGLQWAEDELATVPKRGNDGTAPEVE